MNDYNNEIFKRMIVENKMHNKNKIQKDIAVKDNGDIFHFCPTVEYDSGSSSGGIDSFIGYTNNKIVEDEYELYILCCVNSSDNDIIHLEHKYIYVSGDKRNHIEITYYGKKHFGNIFYDPFSYGFIDSNDNNITLNIPLILCNFDKDDSDDIKRRDYYIKCGLNVVTFEKDFREIQPSELINIGYKTGEDTYVFYVQASRIYG